MSRKELIEAVAYIRTSSATNVGADKDSDRRQREAITAFARRAGYSIVQEFFDEAVKGTDAVDVRPGFAAMLKLIAGNDVQTIIVETANRFARDLIVQETGHRMLRDQGIMLIAADSPDAFIEETPTTVLIRQVLGAVAQFEKAALVAKLKGARDRKRAETGKCGGRKSYVERDGDMVALARRLHRYPVGGRRRSLREVSAELASQGYVAASGKPFGVGAIARMIEQKLGS
jgi:DNA invertase Pin-like site-specific DNA recombinase